MKRFTFKLQPLLNYREYLERIAQQNTAKANMEVKNCEEQILDLQQMYDRHVDQIERIVDKGVSATYFRQYHQFIDSVEIGIENEKVRKIKLQEVLKEKLVELQKKSIDKKVIQLYREKLRTQYNQKILLAEQKELDEISSLKTARTLSDETM